MLRKQRLNVAREIDRARAASPVATQTAWADEYNDGNE